MVTKSYSDEEFIQLINQTNILEPYAFYIVDSFGSIDKKNFMRYFLMAEHNLKKEITLGFHGHNNMQFVFANAINMIENTTSREIIIDSSIFGMGRGAGNLNTEIILDYLNKYYSKNYNIEPILEVMDDYLETLYKSNPWGFTPSQYLSARYSCHPNYASYLTNKKRLSIAAINEILSLLPDEKKNSFSENYIEELYISYNKKNVSIETFDFNMLKNKNVLILGSGSSIEENIEELKKYSTDEHIVISLNNAREDIQSDIQFFSNQKRYDEYKELIDSSKLLCTSNINHHNQCNVLDYSNLLIDTLNNDDNVLSLCLSFLKNNKPNQVLLAGIDGYKINEKNYTHENIILNDIHKMEEENKKIHDTLEYFSKSLNIEFITPSLFKDAVSLKILGVIPARYKSSRFEGKPLCLIKDIPMVKRTYNQAKKSTLLTDLIVATDSEIIKAYCESENIPVIMTSATCLTGTDRIAEVASQLHYDLYVNIQGDEPVIDPMSIDEVVSEYKKYGDDYVAYNLYKVIDDSTEINSNTIIKVIINEKDELIYMSRLGIPFNKSTNQVQHKKQVCVYGFTKKALELFSRLS